MLERRFAVVDTDGNGVWQHDDGQLLTRRLCEAFGLAADSATGQAMASAQRDLFDAMLSHMDANHDAQISRDEFVTAVGRAIKDRPGFDAAVRTTARALIEVADADGNGVLDAGEYTRLAAVYGVGAEEACAGLRPVRPGSQRDTGHRRIDRGDQPVLRQPGPPRVRQRTGRPRVRAVCRGGAHHAPFRINISAERNVVLGAGRQYP